MAAADDAVSTLKTVATNLGALVSAQRIGNTFPIAGVLGTTVGTTNQIVIAASTTRTEIVFHNASTTVPVIVAPASDINGNTLAPTFSSPAGGFVVLPLDYLAFAGNVQTSWSAAAQTTATNPLTIITSNF